jgi:myosin heavy subunit
VPTNSFGVKPEAAPVQKAAASPPKPVEEPKETPTVAKQTNGFSRPVAASNPTRNYEAEKKELQQLLVKKKELEERKTELDRMIEDEDQKNIALSNEIRSRTEKNNTLRSALADEERKNSRLKRDLDQLADKSQKLADTVRTLEAQVDRERQAQRNFNLAERTQRIQTHYSQLRSTMSNYYEQINSALPLLMLLSNGNARLGDIMPLLMGTIGEFNNGESIFAQLAAQREQHKKMSDAEFANIAAKKWRASMAAINQTYESCPICYMDYEHDVDLKVLSCNHAYHPSCLLNWVKKNACCPFCKKDAK